MPLTPSTPAALAAASACFCATPAFQQAEISYLLAVLRGGSTNPSTLAQEAKCWQCVSPRILLVDQVYLLSVLAGGSQVPSVLAKQSVCYCFPVDVMWSVRVKILASAVGITNPNTLAKAATCFCFSTGYQQALITYLLSVLAGGSTDPGTIGKNAVQFSGIPDQNLQQIWTMLMANWAGVSPGPPVSGAIILPDGVGGFWRLIVDAGGNIGTTSDPGPATSDAILADGVGGFWKIVADGSGNRGTVSSAGPATTPAPTLIDSNLVTWTLIAGNDGSLGATS